MIIAVINQKGGVGKTTTAANLGAALAVSGAALAMDQTQKRSEKTPKLRLIDLDVQGSLLRYRKTIKRVTFHTP